MRTLIPGGERGIALVVTILALAVLSALVAAEWFVGVEEARIGEGQLRAGRAFGLAEEGVLEIVHGWTPSSRTPLPYPYDSLGIPDGFPVSWTAAPHGRGAFGAFVYRLNGELSLVDLSARGPDGPTGPFAARQRTALIVHSRPLRTGLRAAITAGGRVRASGRVRIDGSDRTPPGWTGCGRPDSALGGVLVRSDSALTRSLEVEISGDPPVAIDSGVEPSSARLGDLAFAQIVAAAQRPLPGGQLGPFAPAFLNGRCDDAVITNRGDGANPSGACGDYFPVTYVAADAAISGAGQGILFANGSLTIRSPASWFGLVVVRGALTLTTSGADDVAILGGVAVRDSVTLQAGPGGGSVLIGYSKCSNTKALEPLSPVGGLRTRASTSLPEVP